MENFEKFYQKTLHFLSFRPRSEKEIKDYLKKKKADDLTSQRIISSLKDNKFLDDREFTKWWVEQRTIIKPRAWRIIKIELKRKGIGNDLINDLRFKINDTDAAIKLAEKKFKTISKLEDRRKIYEKIGRFLASKGFDWDTIKEVIDRILPR